MGYRYRPSLDHRCVGLHLFVSLWTLQPLILVVVAFALNRLQYGDATGARLRSAVGMYYSIVNKSPEFNGTLCFSGVARKVARRNKWTRLFHSYFAGETRVHWLAFDMVRSAWEPAIGGGFFHHGCTLSPGLTLECYSLAPMSRRTRERRESAAAGILLSRLGQRSTFSSWCAQ